MSQRLISLALVALVGATSVAREICAVSCAEHHAGSTTSGHAHHDHGPSMTGHHTSHHHADASGTAHATFRAKVSAGVHGCKHEVESQPASISAKLAIAAPGFVVHTIDPVAGPVCTAGFSAAVHVTGLAPVPIALLTPLRV